jgi:hypothetical protein
VSTRSQIGIKYNDNCYKTIYCHFDGYPSGVGLTLIERYNNLEAAEALIELGDISGLANSPKSTAENSYFVRDGSPINIAIFSNIEDYFIRVRNTWAEYAYLFDVAAGAWFLQKSETKKFHLETYLKEPEAE